LGWSFPSLTVDFFAEFRVRTNGLPLEAGSTLLGAQRYFGLPAIEDERKILMRRRIQAGPPYTTEERKEILAYCETDVIALVDLLPFLIDPRQNLTPAFWRAEYMKVMADAEWAGVPLDAQLYHSMVEHWRELQNLAIDRVNKTIPVFDGRSFRMARFENWLGEQGWLERWPRTDDGALALDEDTFRREAAIHPELEPLRQVRQMLGQLKKPGLTVGSDSRNRCLLSAFGTITGRNRPSTTKNIFGCPKWMRGLIRPEDNTALSYLDWRSQEFAIAAALSGDTNMQHAYLSGDCYLGFAKMAAAAPMDATEQTHPEVRELFKRTVLGTQYLISAGGLACELEITWPEAENLLNHHRRLFPRFWQWSDSVCDYGQLFGELTAAFGWRMQLSSSTSLRTLRNFPMQSNASEMLRLGAIYAREAGARIVATIHDAILIEAPVADISHAVWVTQEAMRRASEAVLAGFSLETKVKTIYAPDRFEEKCGREMWQWIQAALVSR
jgi:hypothetical protein